MRAWRSLYIVYLPGRVTGRTAGGNAKDEVAVSALDLPPSRHKFIDIGKVPLN